MATLLGKNGIVLLVMAACAGCGSGGGTDTAGTHGDCCPPGLEDGDLPGTPDLPDTAGPESAADVPEGEESAGRETAAETPPPPHIDHAVCGAPEYEWLPSSAVGGVVLFEEHQFTNLSGKDIDQAMKAAGHPELVPVPYGVRNFRLRYVTQDRGKTVEATALVGIPVGEGLPGKLPVMLWLHGTTGFMDLCAPSADLLAGPAQTTIVSSQGYVSVAPDYIGMLGFGDKSPPGTIHPYLAGEATAVACLDAVRAALTALAEAGDLPQGDPDRLAMMGGSQGGHAAFFTELYAPYYAPDLTVVAAAAAVPPTDLVGQATWGANHFGATAMTLMAAFVAWNRWYGYPDGKLAEVLADEEPNFVATQLPQLMAGGCKVAGTYELDELSDLYAPEVLAKGSAGKWDELQPWGCFLAENSVGRGSVPRISDTPFLATFAQNDDLVITSVEQESFGRLCEAGYRIQYLECKGKGHSEGGIAALPFVFHWLEARLNGTPFEPEDYCTLTPPEDCGGL